MCVCGAVTVACLVKYEFCLNCAAQQQRECGSSSSRASSNVVLHPPPTKWRWFCVCWLNHMAAACACSMLMRGVGPCPRVALSLSLSNSNKLRQAVSELSDRPRPTMSTRPYVERPSFTCRCQSRHVQPAIKAAQLGKNCVAGNRTKPSASVS